MNLIANAFKHNPIFRRKENEQAPNEVAVMQNPAIVEHINQSLTKLEGTVEEIVKEAPVVIPQPVRQDNPEQALNEGRPEPNNQEPPTLPNAWIYDGQAYDLSDFIKKHPGGEFFIGRMKNRDITILVNIFHPNPQKVKKILQKYALNRPGVPEDIHPKYAAPEFLFREGFDSWRDTPKFDFESQGQLLDQIKTRLNKPEMKKKIAQMDFWFDAVTVTLGILYILVQVLRLGFTEYMPMYLFVPLMIALRISLAGAGHYFIHRPQVGLNKAVEQIFDINYVPMAFVVTDGHSLMHHPCTQSEVDIKRNVFTAMLELPRFYRVPVHSIHKFAHVLTGMFVRSFEICMLGFKFGVKDLYGSWQGSLLHYVGLFAMRILLFGELIVFYLHGDLVAWLTQFVLTLWISTFMIVASHDFEEVDKDDAIKQTGDWAVFQIQNSYDLTMIGNKYIDCFLSAGLSPHRVHHVLPYQKSGFANIISEDVVREEAEKYNVAWLKPKNFFVDRLPILFSHYLFSPSRRAKENKLGILQEHLHPQELLTSLQYILKGFVGIGSI
ncbi:cytochrome b5-like heme/steroid binding domain-containing protein [Nostoc sp. FACHB-110]|uniref:cytochrome b5-like heme/steroid binding domain-containing protein n=1 Tax=Nostoc sp. FACHB-110 TaxID=2692834 RepID=UPI0016860A0A|nr:cytochrome b5-like heme/steroid binding domain-containing protein [Nostoc sp. FACHB-110]MBD2435588.1 cytochrome b5 domain-containing protein [Nostoc sp. FACHB-110]